MELSPLERALLEKRISTEQFLKETCGQDPVVSGTMVNVRLGLFDAEEGLAIALARLSQQREELAVLATGSMMVPAMN